MPLVYRGVMKIFTIAFLLTLTASAIAAPLRIHGLYVSTYGDASKPPLIFIHGGPAYNSWDFEFSTAPVLAKAGYYVIVYDERGQGRSDAADASQLNYRQYADDLKEIIDTLHLQQPALIGHSHGGPIAIRFDETYPGVARKVVLVSAPVHFWGSLHSLFENCSRRYQEKNDQLGLDELTYIYYGLFSAPKPPLDQYAGFVSAAFRLNVACGLYRTSHPSAEELALRADLKAHPLSGPLSGELTSVPAFLANEDYVHFDGVDHVATHRDHFCGIYGDEDGLFTPLELSLIRNALQQPGEPARFQLIAGASHGLYMDQQAKFIEALKNTCLVRP